MHRRPRHGHVLQLRDADPVAGAGGGPEAVCCRRERGSGPEARDRHDPGTGDGCGAEGERGASRDRDGAGAARLRALPASAAAQPGQPELGEPRPLHPLRRPRLHPPVRDPPPDRLQPLARGAQALPPVGVEDTGPSGALRHRGRRDDHRPARAGLRERRRLRHRRPLPRRALQPAPRRDRRPLRLRDLLGRRSDGGPLLRGGVDRRPPRPRPARLLLRRQPHHDRRHHRAHVHDRGQGEALRGAGLARAVDRRLGGRRRDRARDAGRAGGRRRAVADHRPQPHRLRGAEGGRHREIARRAARRGGGRGGEEGARARSRQALRRVRRGLRAHGHAPAGDRVGAGVEAAVRALGGGVPGAEGGVGRGSDRQAATGLDRGAARSSRPARRSRAATPARR